MNWVKPSQRSGNNQLLLDLAPWHQCRMEGPVQPPCLVCSVFNGHLMDMFSVPALPGWRRGLSGAALGPGWGCRELTALTHQVPVGLFVLF